LTISEVSEQYGLTADTLRYYEKIGLIPRVERKKNGVRDYQEEDCKQIAFIKCMRSAGMPVETLLRYMSLIRQGEETSKERMGLLVEQQEILLKKRQEMDDTLKRLEDKIACFKEKEKSKKRQACGCI
jgi:DNA-binding transcriptional MerR regulator